MDCSCCSCSSVSGFPRIVRLQICRPQRSATTQSPSACSNATSPAKGKGRRQLVVPADEISLCKRFFDSNHKLIALSWAQSNCSPNRCTHLGTQLLDGGIVYYLDAPTVQHHCGRSLYLLHQFRYVLALIAAAPAQAAGQVVAGTQRYYPNGRLCHHLDGVCVRESVRYNSVAFTSCQLTHRLEHPTHCSVAAAADYFEIGQILK